MFGRGDGDVSIRFLCLVRPELHSQTPPFVRSFSRRQSRLGFSVGLGGRTSNGMHHSVDSAYSTGDRSLLSGCMGRPPATHNKPACQLRITDWGIQSHRIQSKMHWGHRRKPTDTGPAQARAWWGSIPIGRTRPASQSNRHSPFLWLCHTARLSV